MRYLPHNCNLMGLGWDWAIVSFKTAQVTCSQGDLDHLTLSHVVLSAPEITHITNMRGTCLKDRFLGSIVSVYQENVGL